MASSGNFCTWNALTGIKDDGSSGITFANGNTSASMTHNGISCLGTHGIKSGKWYYEINYHADGNYSDGRLHAGWTSDLKGIKYAFFRQAGGSPDREGFGVHLWFYRNNYQGGKISYQSSTDYTGNTGASNSNLKATQANDIIMCAIDADNHKMYWGLNGNWGSTNTNGATATNSDITQVDGWSIESTWQGSTWMPAIWFAGASSGTTAIINAGQDSTFSGTKTSGSANASDSNGVGNFYYTPPNNFLALSSSALPISDDIDPAQTDDDFPTKQFGVVTYSGTGSNGNAITGLGFQPDLLWLKQRNATSDYSNALVDSSRGRTKVIYSHSTRAELTSPADKDVKSFDSDGFTVDVSEQIGINSGSGTYVAWCWRANGGVTSSNTDGDITTTVQANQKAGFSIFTYTGNGGGAGTSMGHGLSQAPDIWFLKQRSNNGESSQKNWRVMLNTGVGGAFRSLSGSNQTLVLNESSAAAGLYRTNGNFEPTSTVVQAPDNGNANSFFVVSGNTYVSYCWHSVEGYSKFGSYIGNGNDDGPFIYLGFRPRLVAIKWLTGVNSAENWGVFDTARSTSNPSSNDSTSQLQWDTEGAGSNTSAHKIDFLSNGFKMRGSGGLNNTNGATYIYMCWADVPYKYNNTF
mgnify:CR=1 FL=1